MTYPTPMRRPDPVELEFALWLFLLVVPWGWFALRALLALINAI